MRKVVITGIGCISAIGKDVTEFAESLKQGVNGVKPITRFDASNIRGSVAAEVPGYEPTDHFERGELRLLDRYSQYALLATKEAVTDSGLQISDELKARTTVVHGTGIGGIETQNEGFHQLYDAGSNGRVHPFSVPKLIPSASASQISMKYGITGPTFATTSACASSGHAILMAVMMIRNGMVDAAITGGAEAPIVHGCYVAWEGLRVMTKDLCRPFSIKRGGMAFGEGGASFVLESEEHARARGAKIYAEVAGCGMSSDAYHIVAPSVEGPQSAMEAALKEAALVATDISYINAHGSGTGQNDSTETEAIDRAFGEHAKKLAISSTKSMHGHLLGGASALELVATLVAMRDQFAPPTINYLGPDPKCYLDYVPNEARELKIENAMSNSFAFGGLNTSIVLKAYK